MEAKLVYGNTCPYYPSLKPSQWKKKYIKISFPLLIYPLAVA